MAFNKAASVLAKWALAMSAVLTCGYVGHAQQQALLIALLPPGGVGGMHGGGQGYLGVRIRTVGNPATTALHLKETHGVVVMVVDHDGPAWKAGMRENDVVQSVNGVPVDAQDQLSHMLRDMAPGRSVQITISRDGVQQNLVAVMADRDEVGKRAWEQHWVVPAPQDSASDDPVPALQASRPLKGFGHGFVSGHLLPGSVAYTGAMVDEVGSQLAEYFGLKGGTGLLVHSVDANSPASIAGLHAGDVITKLNGTPMNSRNDWNRALHDSKGHPVSVTVMHEHHEQILTIVPDGKRRSSVKAPEQQNDWLASLLH